MKDDDFRDRPEREDAYPRAPSQEEWDAMTPEERARVERSLPGVVTWDEMALPEGGKHFRAKRGALEALEGFFKHHRRDVYVEAELPVYYPGEKRFAPDLLAVVGVDTHLRDKWLVTSEGKGLDWVLEVHVGGNRKKDTEENVERYARLGITEYVIFDRQRLKLNGFRLASPKARVYTPIEPRDGRFHSEVLGLDLQIVGERLCFWNGDEMLLESADLIDQLKELTRQEEQRRREAEHRRKDVERRLALAERQRDEAARQRDEEAKRRAEAERRLAELQRTLKRPPGQR